MRAAMLAVLILIGCGKPNPDYVDPSANVSGDDAGAGFADDLGSPAGGDDLGGPRLAFAPRCGGVSGSLFTLSGQPFAVYLVIVDGTNQPIDTNADVLFSLESADHPTVLTGGGVAAATHGFVSFEKVSLDHWGKGRLIATSPGVASLEIDFTVHGGQGVWLTQPSDTVAGHAMTPSARVAVVDQTGAFDEGYSTLAVGLTGCGRSPSDNIATAATVAGVATFDGLAIGPACDGYQMQLNGQGDPYGYSLLNPPFLSNAFAVTKGPPTRVALSTARSYVTRKMPFTVVASIEDDGGNVIAVAPTSIALSLTGAALSGTTTQTTSAGVATFDGLVVDPTGTYALTGHADGYTDGQLSLRVSPWEERSKPGVGGVAVAIDDPNTVYGWNSQNVLVSHDGALTWSVIRSYPFAGPITPDPTDAKTLWGCPIGLGGSVSRSSDAGATWSYAGAANAVRLVIDRHSPTTLVALGAQDSQNGPIPTVWISHDGAATWAASGPALGPLDTYGDVVIDSGVIYVSVGQSSSGPASGFLARSSDGGATWTKLPGTSWMQHLGIDPFVPTTLLGTLVGNALLGRSTDSGSTWTWSADQIGGVLGMNPGLAGHYLVSTDNSGTGVLLSTDGGTSWITSFGSQEATYPFTGAIAFAPSDPTVVYLSGDTGEPYVFRSLTSGE